MRGPLQIFLQTATEAADAMLARAAAPYRVVMEARISAPSRLRIAPEDIRTIDATVEEEIYAGYFSFDGKAVNARGRSPFALPPPTTAWRRSLCGFSWLRHLRNGPIAQELVQKFMDSRGFPTEDPASEPAVSARRTLSFLAHSPLLLQSADASFRESFFANLASGVKALTRALVWGRVRGPDRLLGALAIVEFCICADASADLQSQATKLFIEELERQILPDGGHVGRNPQTALDFLLDLLPLRQLYAARGVNPPQALLAVINRMIPMLRLLQHGDGALALFNGMGATDPGELATVFTHEAPTPPPLDAPQSGYRRMTAGDAALIVDTGPPPPWEFSRYAHASALAFEFSLGAERVIVNCGAPLTPLGTPREVARATPAHSTLAIDDDSSCLIAPASGRPRAGIIVSGPTAVACARRSAEAGETIELAHDGYARRYGLIHKRKLSLASDGSTLSGEESLVADARRGMVSAREFALRFHLHPNVRATLREDAPRVDLLLPSGVRLQFEAPVFTPELTESVFYAAPEGGRRTKQIVVRSPASRRTPLRWTLSLVESARPRDLCETEGECESSL
jgi:uncharacterized heparinase superfamily protein